MLVKCKIDKNFCQKKVKKASVNIYKTEKKLHKLQQKKKTKILSEKLKKIMVNGTLRCQLTQPINQFRRLSLIAQLVE